MSFAFNPSDVELGKYYICRWNRIERVVSIEGRIVEWHLVKIIGFDSSDINNLPDRDKRGWCSLHEFAMRVYREALKSEYS